MRRSIILIAVLTVVTLFAATPALATFPGSGGWNLFVRIDSGPSYELRTIQASSGVNTAATLEANVSLPGAYSPNGNKITFANNTGGDYEIWIQKEDGSDAHPITMNASYDLSPHFSPDGSKIVFTRVGSLWTMDVDGSHQEEIDPGGSITWPVWSPNGNWILFSAIDGPGGWDLFRIHPDGSGLDPVAATMTDELMADYAPDGRSIVYQRSTAPAGDYEVYRMDADGRHKQLLISKPGFDLNNPMYSASGRRVLYNHWDNVNMDIWSARASDGRDRKELLATDDNNYLAFVD